MPLVCLLLTWLLTGCGSIPADPRDTLEKVRSTGELVIGVSPAQPWTVVDGPEDVSGTEVDLARGFAERLGVRPRWVVGGEQSLVAELEDGSVHLLVGGFTSDTPWKTLTGPTRSYATTEDEQGRTQEHVLLAPLGENEFLSELERYLDERMGRLR